MLYNMEQLLFDTIYFVLTGYTLYTNVHKLRAVALSLGSIVRFSHCFEFIILFYFSVCDMSKNAVWTVFF